LLKKAAYMIYMKKKVAMWPMLSLALLMFRKMKVVESSELQSYINCE